MPIGHADFVGAHAAGRLEAEADLLQKLQRLPDLQSAWLLLAYCAAPRAQHLLRNIPRRIYCLTPAPTTRQSGMLSKACLAVRALTGATPPVRSLCRRASGASACFQPSGCRLQPTWPRGCRSSAHATPKSLTGLCMSLRASRRGQQAGSTCRAPAR